MDEVRRKSIAELVVQRDAITARLDEEIANARTEGWTWTELARVLGTSPQAVQQRMKRRADAAPGA